MDRVLTSIESIVRDKLADWPKTWEGFHWPGYTYEHTLRVRNLALKLGAAEGADPQIVELAAFLHDIEKQAGRSHAAAGAQTARAILADLGSESSLVDAVTYVIATHTGDNTPQHPIENRVLGDADLIDANFGLVATWRFITIRAGHQAPLDETITSMAEWLPKKDALAELLLTDSGRRIARERSVRMHSFCQAMAADFARTDRNGEFTLSDLAEFIVADYERPQLCRQLESLELLRAQRPVTAPVREALAGLQAEIAGDM